MKFSTRTLVAPGVFWFCAYTRTACGGDHWCGCVPSNVALDVVAKRVCPTMIRVRDFCLAIFRPPLSRSAFARTSLERSVRFMFTTRERAPRRAEALSPSRGVEASKVTTPPLCAPRIIVTYTIFSSTSNALRPFSEQHHAWFRSTIPKFPHSSCDTWRGAASSRSVIVASSAVSQNARRASASGEASSVLSRRRAPALSAARRACRRSATSAIARLAAKPASRTNSNAPAHRVSNASGKRTWRPSTTLAIVFSASSARMPCCSTGHAKLTFAPARTTKAYARTCASSCTHPART